MQLEKIHHIQQSFRAVMDAMARPGTLRAIPDYSTDKKAPERAVFVRDAASMTGNFYVDTLVTLLVDQAVGFCVLGQDAHTITNAVREQTHARAVPVGEAAFVIVPQSDAAAQAIAFSQASGGQLIAPEKGATLILACEQLVDSSRMSEKDDLYWVSVEGPGVRTSHVFGMSDIDWAWQRSKRADEYPCGIDIILVDQEGRLVALPRTSFVSPLVVAADQQLGEGEALRDLERVGTGAREGKEVPWGM